MQYSPKLKNAAQEIKDILKKHDIAGVIVLHTPGYSEYMVKLDPTYSCAKTSGDKVTFNSSAMHFNGDDKKRVKVITQTLDMMHGLSTVLGRVAVPLIDLSTDLNYKAGIDRGVDNFSSHVTQSN